LSDKQQNTPQNVGLIRCEDIESLAVLYACDELDAGARAELDAHAAACPACAAVLSREGRLQQAVASLEQPADSLDRSGLLLAQCRSQLAESLDDQQARANRSAWRSIFSPVAWWGALRHTLIYHPAMSMTFLVVAGFLAGVAGQRLRVVPSQAVSPRPVMTVSASPKISDQQLQSAGSAHVAWVTPSGSRTPTVQVQLMSQTPMNIVGAPDDADVERALTFVLENSQRFDPDARLDSLDVLRTRAADPAVRRSLCAAARLDRNPGVRRDSSRIPRSGRLFSMRCKATTIPACASKPSIFSSARCNPITDPPRRTRKRWKCCATACGMIPTITFACKARQPCASSANSSTDFSLWVFGSR
jgi:hypothetical protein